MTSAGASARGVAAARAAYERAAALIERDPDLLAALAAASRLGDGLREIFEDSAALRARIVTAVIDSGAMTRKELADHLGVTRGRVDQLYRAGSGRAR